MSDVAIVCGAGMISGKEIMVSELITGLREQGHDVEVVTSSWGSADFRRRCENLGFRTHVMRLGFISATLNWACLRMTMHQLLHWPGLLWGYNRFLRTSRPHRIIHTNWHHLLLLALFLRPQRDLFWVHEVIPSKAQYRKFFRWLERHLQCFVAVSHAVADSLRKLGINDAKIRVVHNGIADPVPQESFKKPPVRSRAIGIVGQVAPWKGHDDLFDAFVTTSVSSPEARLHIFGKGSSAYECKLRQRAISLGIADRIVWHGFVADRAQIYRDIAICVVPSRCEEPFGMTVVEAGFFGIPVIATRRGGLPEIIEDGRTGFLVNAAQPQEIASRLETLLADNTLRAEMGKAARQHATEKFSSQRLVNDFSGLLEAN